MCRNTKELHWREHWLGIVVIAVIAVYYCSQGAHVGRPRAPLFRKEEYRNRYDQRDRGKRFAEVRRVDQISRS